MYRLLLTTIDTETKDTSISSLHLHIALASSCNYQSYCNSAFRKNVAVLFVVCKGLETREGYDTTLSMMKQIGNITMTDKSNVAKVNFENQNFRVIQAKSKT